MPPSGERSLRVILMGKMANLSIISWKIA